MRDNRSGILDDFGVTILKIHGFGQQLDQPRIHTGKNYHPFIWKFRGQKLLILFRFYKFLIIVQDFTN
jgi:hypothetical protein